MARELSPFSFSVSDGAVRIATIYRDDLHSTEELGPMMVVSAVDLSTLLLMTLGAIREHGSDEAKDLAAKTCVAQLGRARFA